MPRAGTLIFRANKNIHQTSACREFAQLTRCSLDFNFKFKLIYVKKSKRLGSGSRVIQHSSGQVNSHMLYVEELSRMLVQPNKLPDMWFFIPAQQKLPQHDTCENKSHRTFVIIGIFLTLASPSSQLLISPRLVRWVNRDEHAFVKAKKSDSANTDSVGTMNSNILAAAPKLPVNKHGIL